MILLAAALCTLVAFEAQHQVTIAVNGARAVFYLDQAEQALRKADAAANTSYNGRYIQLIGQGTEFQNQMTSATQELLLAAEDNAAGPQAAAKIQFSEGLLVVYTGLIQQAGIDYPTGGGPLLAKAELGYATSLIGTESARCSSPWNSGTAPPGIQASLDQLICGETGAVRTAENSGWLTPAAVWPTLLSPFLIMLLVASGTSYVLWRGYRRLISGRLAIAIAAELSLVAMVAALNTRDSGQLSRYFSPLLNGQHLPAPPSLATVNASYTYFWWTLTAGLFLAAVAASLAYSSYQPRIREYRYPR